MAKATAPSVPGCSPHSARDVARAAALLLDCCDAVILDPNPYRRLKKQNAA